MARPVIATVCLLSWAYLVNGFYLPGAAPRTFNAGDRVELLVNALTPMMTNEEYGVKSLINYEYYDPQFHFCKPEGGPQKQSESLGSILFGDRIFNSPFNISMLQGNGTCNTLCRTSLPSTDAKFMIERIQEEYAMNWIVDGLPAASWQQDIDTGEEFYEMGFPLGSNGRTAGGGPVLHNHYEIILQYHSPRPEQYRIVGVLVFPRSVGGSQNETPNCANDPEIPKLSLEESGLDQVRYSYSLSWEESPTPWATRWDNYLHLKDTRVHWVSLANASIFVVLLCVSVSTILVRSVSRDITRYNEIDTEEIQEDFGWKLVHGEVFRTPQAPLLLSVLVGNGAQLCAMVAVTLVFALLGFLSPSNRGSIATVMIVCWSFFGVVGGYVSARLYESLRGTEQRRCTFLTATALPTVIFGCVFFLNLFLIAAGSSGAVPFGTLMVIVLLWFVISAPLSAVGSYFGTKHGGISHPVRTNQIPRQIPPVPTYLKPTYLTILAGILPFGAMFMELYYVLTSIFASRAYYAFGFVSLTAGIFAVTTAMVSILFTYFLLCAEEYRWHWRAFLAGGGSAVWVFGYGFYYWARRLTFGSAASVVLYFGYLGLLAMLTFLVTGTIGFLSTYWAVRRLYSSIRVD